jgi:hypothetical protein
MRSLDKIATAIVLFLGAGHVVLTPEFAPGLTEGAAWFSGAGLALLFTGFFNLARLFTGTGAPALTRLCQATNLLALAWMVLVLAVMPVGQAYGAAAAVLVLTILSLWPRRAVLLSPG